MLKSKRTIAIILTLALICSSLILLASCEDGRETKVQEVKSKYAELIELNNDFTGALNLLQENGYELDEGPVSLYNELVDFINEFGEIDMNGMSTDELDDLLKAVNILISRVNSERSKLSGEIDALQGGGYDDDYDYDDDDE